MSLPMDDFKVTAMTAPKEELESPRVEVVINEAKQRWPHVGKHGLAAYFEGVHQLLAPLSRQLEKELAAAKESNDRLTGMKFSDRMHAALVSRAIESEAALKLAQEEGERLRGKWPCIGVAGPQDEKAALIAWISMLERDGAIEVYESMKTRLNYIENKGMKK